MKQIAVIGRRSSIVTANLIGTMLRRTTGRKVGVLNPEDREDALCGGLHQLALQGCDCAVAALRDDAAGESFQVGILTDWGDGPIPKAAGACERLVVSMDDECGKKLAAERAAFTYSERRDEADLTAKNLRCYPDRIEFEALTWSSIHRVRMPVLGGYDIYHGLAALGCGLSMGYSLDQLVPSIEQAAGVPGHLEQIPTDQPFCLVVDQASHALELEDLLLTLRPMRGKGGMLRLLPGAVSEEEWGLASDVAGGLADEVIRPGGDRNQNVHELLNRGRAGDVLVIAGVHDPGSKDDERRMAAQWLQHRSRSAV